MFKNISFSDFLCVKISRCLKGNLLTSLSLTLIFITAYIIYCFMFEVFIFLSCQILNNYNYSNYAVIIDKYSLYLNLFASVLFISPLNLSIKNWYYNLDEVYQTDINEAFIVYNSFGYYFKSLLFCIVKTFTIIISSIISLIPIAFVLGVFKFMILTNNYSDTITTIVLCISIIVLTAGLITCIINLFGYLFADYLFLSTIDCKANLLNYFRIIKHSKQLSNENSKNFIITLIKLSPYAILSLVFPFAISSYNLGIAIYIKKTLNNF